MQIFLSAFLYGLTALALFWAINLSFAAHVVEEPKQTNRYHLATVAVLLFGMFLCFLGTYILVD